MIETQKPQPLANPFLARSIRSLHVPPTPRKAIVGYQHPLSLYTTHCSQKCGHELRARRRGGFGDALIALSDLCCLQCCDVVRNCPKARIHATNRITNLDRWLLKRWRPLQLPRKRRLIPIRFSVDSGDYSEARGDIVCNKDCMFVAKLQREFARRLRPGPVRSGLARCWRTVRCWSEDELRICSRWRRDRQCAAGYRHQQASRFPGSALITSRRRGSSNKPAAMESRPGGWPFGAIVAGRSSTCSMPSKPASIFSA